MNGFVKLHLKFLDWEWYQNINTKVLFIHCLLKANFKDKKIKNIEIKRGSFITSIANLSQETGLSIQQTRTALNNLQSTNEITIKSTTKFTVITINNYETYQYVTNKITDNQQTNNMQPNKQITTTEDIYIYITSYLERIYARALSNLEVQKIDTWIKEFDYKAILHAIDISVMNNAKNFKYVEGILRNWKTAGFKTLEDVLAEEERLAKVKGNLLKDNEEFKPIDENISNYDWLNEEII